MIHSNQQDEDCKVGCGIKSPTSVAAINWRSSHIGVKLPEECQVKTVTFSHSHQLEIIRCGVRVAEGMSGKDCHIQSQPSTGGHSGWGMVCWWDAGEKLSHSGKGMQSGHRVAEHRKQFSSISNSQASATCTLTNVNPSNKLHEDCCLSVIVMDNFGSLWDREGLRTLKALVWCSPK